MGTFSSSFVFDLVFFPNYQETQSRYTCMAEAYHGACTGDFGRRTVAPQAFTPTIHDQSTAHQHTFGFSGNFDVGAAGTPEASFWGVVSSSPGSVLSSGSAVLPSGASALVLGGAQVLGWGACTMGRGLSRWRKLMRERRGRARARRRARRREMPVCLRSLGCGRIIALALQPISS